MDKAGYIAIMRAVGELIYVLMVQAGKVPTESARKIVKAFLQASTGQS